MNGSTPKSVVTEYWEGDICWITPADLGILTSPYIESSARTITQAGYDSCSTRIVPPGTVVLSSRAPIGHLGIASIPLCTNQGCKAFVPRDSVDGSYLYYALLHSVDDLRALGSGATFTEISKRTLSTFTIPLPLIDEQRAIVATLEREMAATERARTAAHERLALAEALPGAILRRAFAPGAPA